MSIEEQVAEELESQRRLIPVDLSALAQCGIDPTRYAVAHILPRGHVTLLGSHGGAGKSMLAEIIAAHVATGTFWAGLSAEKGRVVFVSLEDPGELVRYRLRRICEAYGLPHGDVATNLSVLDGSDSDSVLAVEVASAGTRSLAFTMAMDEIEDAARGCRLLIIDNASDAFSGNENERQLVRAFIRKLAHIARKQDCAVLLLAHIDKAAARFGSNGNSYSGSTAWHNTVRSRLALIEEVTGINLVQEKFNLGRKIDPIRLEWTDTGVLEPVPDSGTEAVERESQDEADVLAAIAAATADGSTVHTARKGPYSTLGVLETYPELPKALRKDKPRFWAALTRLERVHKITKETYTDTYRHKRARFIVCAFHPHTPCVGTHAQGGVPAFQRVLTRNAVGTQGTQCPSCDGAGCKWCARKAGGNID